LGNVRAKKKAGIAQNTSARQTFSKAFFPCEDIFFSFAKDVIFTARRMSDIS